MKTSITTARQGWRPIAQPPALLRLGFRPFFFLAGAWSVVAMAAWIAMLVTEFRLPTAATASLWHAHEFVLGFGFAVIAGFLLTAIPNWTGRLPVNGVPLAILAGLWVISRTAMAIGGLINPVTGIIGSLAFPVIFTLLVAREIFAGDSWRNLPILIALICLLLADAVFQISVFFEADHHDIALRLGIAVLTALIALIGGRVTPSFTRNWLVKRGGSELPAPTDRFDRMAMVATVAALILWVVVPQATITSIVLFAAALALGLRLSRWRGLQCWREPLLFVLHIGYGWLPVGLALLGWSIVSVELSMAGAQHGLTTGAVGTMTLAMMTRASLGHSDRPLAANSVTVAIFVLITLAGLGRVLAGFASENAIVLMALSASAWIGAFGLFVLSYSPILFGRAKKN